MFYYVTMLYLRNEQSYSSFVIVTAQKMKFSIKNFFSKCDQLRNFLVLCALEFLIKCPINTTKL